MTYDIFTMIQLDGMCLVSRHPKHIKRDNRNNLHCEEGYAIEFNDGYGQHYLWGVFFDKKLYKQVTGGKMTFKKVMAIENIEQRMAALKILDADKLLKGTKAKLVDKSERGNSLYIVKGLFKTDAYFLRYSCPSTGRVYISGIEPKFASENPKADNCMAFKFNLSINDYNSLKSEA
jgi:hypothetical protein